MLDQKLINPNRKKRHIIGTLINTPYLIFVRTKKSSYQAKKELSNKSILI